MANHAGEALYLLPTVGCLTRFTLTLSGCPWALKARITIRVSRPPLRMKSLNLP
jgi:hypothetical protein